MSGPLQIVAVFKSAPGKVQDLIEVFQTMTPPSRAEPGCLEYGFYQSEEDDSVVLAVETWADEAAFESHFNSDHLKAGIQAMNGLLDEELVVYRCRKIM
jgi:quinol monooxygenase YgiN